MKTGQLRHPDHKFEWTQEELLSWATDHLLAGLEVFGWRLQVEAGVGFLDHVDKAVSGPCTQIIRLRRNGSPVQSDYKGSYEHCFDIVFPSRKNVKDLHAAVTRILLDPWRERDRSIEVQPRLLRKGWEALPLKMQELCGADPACLFEIISRSKVLDITPDGQSYFPFMGSA
jgi:hypothetical protein